MNKLNTIPENFAKLIEKTSGDKPYSRVGNLATTLDSVTRRGAKAVGSSLLRPSAWLSNSFLGTDFNPKALQEAHTQAALAAVDRYKLRDLERRSQFGEISLPDQLSVSTTNPETAYNDVLNRYKNNSSLDKFRKEVATSPAARGGDAGVVDPHFQPKAEVSSDFDFKKFLTNPWVTGTLSLPVIYWLYRKLFGKEKS